jgi:hypothetical protein
MNAGHALFIDAPDEFEKAVREFISMILDVGMQCGNQEL